MSSVKKYLLSTGIGIVVIAFAAFFIFSATGHLCGYLEPGNFDLPGDAHNFDPVAQYDAVAAKAGKGAGLTRIQAYFVRNDGTLDLHASYKPRVVYSFVRENPERGKSDAPKGVGGKADAPYQEIQMNIAKPGRTSRITRRGAGCRSGEYTVRWFGMQRETSPTSRSPKKILEKPQCSFKKIWKIAQQNGADPKAVATIEYNKDGYRFSIRGTKTRLKFDHSCNLK